MIKLTNKHSVMFAMLVSVCTSSLAADIYRAENPDGSFRYATQALNHDYKPYLRDEAQFSSDPLINPAISLPEKQNKLDPIIEHYARKHHVDAKLVRAIIEVESNFNERAVSPKGAMGAMQLMPATATRYGVVRREDAYQNIEAGVRYLKDLLTKHKGNVALALASYNAGEGTIARYGNRVPPYKETMLYVPAVLMRMQSADRRLEISR